MQIYWIQLWDKFHSTILFVTHDISEAVFLGDDIYIMKSVPHLLLPMVPIDLPIKKRNRNKNDPITLSWYIYVSTR